MKNKKKLFFSLVSLLMLAGCDGVSNSDLPSESNGGGIGISEIVTPPSESISAPATDVTEPPVEENLTVSEAYDLALTLGEESTTYKTVTGVIKSISNYYYGQLYLTDSSGKELSVYGLYGEKDTYYDKLDYVPIVGDTITIYGILKTYKGTPEMGKSLIKDIVQTHVTPSDADYQSMTIAQARTSADDTKIKLTGVVAFKSQTQKYNYNGFYLVDETGSIFIYGGMSTVQVQVGNTVTVIGKLAHFIATNEQSLAEKNGYPGALQLTDTYVLENDKQVSEFSKAGIEEKTIKWILDNDISTNNITSSIYKVKTIIKKVPGTGYVNYYLNDLDGETGTYVYTSNNGNDFAWLDSYLDKVVTAYVTPANCKSTASGSIYRFVPVEIVEEDDYVYPVEDIPQFVLDYKVKEQFKASYAGDPAQEVITSYSNTYIGASDVAISYSSSNTEFAYFASEEGKTIFHVNENEGQTATITMTVTSGAYTKSDTVTVTYSNVEAGSITVEQALQANDGDTLKVKGIIGAKVINKNGFYLMGTDHVLACQVADKTILDELKTGDEIVLTGVKSRVTNAASGVTEYTQDYHLYLDSCELLGKVSTGNELPTTSVTDKTFEEIANTPVGAECTTTLYQVSAFAHKTDGQYPQLYFYADSTMQNPYISVYISNYAGSLDFCEPYLEKQVTITFALCNWNKKTYQRMCPFSISDGTTTAYNYLNA